MGVIFGLLVLQQKIKGFVTGVKRMIMTCSKMSRHLFDAIIFFIINGTVGPWKPALVLQTVMSHGHLKDWRCHALMGHFTRKDLL